MKVLGLQIEKVSERNAQIEKESATRFEQNKIHEATVAALEKRVETLTEMHKAEYDRAVLMMTLLAAGMIQARLVVHGNGKKGTVMSLPQNMIDSIAKRDDWALHVQPEGDTTRVTIVNRPAKVETPKVEGEVAYADKP